MRSEIQLTHTAQHNQGQSRSLSIRVKRRAHLRRRRRNQRKETGTRRMLPKTTHPRTILHHRVNQKTHKKQPHHGVKSQDALTHPVRRQSLRCAGTPGSAQCAGAQRHRKIIDRHAEAAAGALLALKGRRHYLPLMVVGQDRGVQPRVYVSTVPGHGQSPRNRGLENHSMF